MLVDEDETNSLMSPVFTQASKYMVTTPIGPPSLDKRRGSCVPELPQIHVCLLDKRM